MSLLDVDSFECAYYSCLESFLVCTSGEHLYIDGKTMRGGKELSFDSACHTISAYASLGLASVAQVYTNGKDSELSGIKSLLSALALRGGYTHQSDVNVWSVGLGAQLGQWRVDAGYDLHSQSAFNYLRLGVGLTL